MKRRIQIFTLTCAVIYAPTLSAGLLSDFKEVCKEIIDYGTDAVKQVFETPGTEPGSESPAKSFLNALDTMSDQKLTELKNFGHSLLTTGSFIGLTTLTGCFAMYALHNTILEYIQYKHQSDHEQKAIHADHIKYYATIASITACLCSYSIYSVIPSIRAITQTLPVPFAQ